MYQTKGIIIKKEDRLENDKLITIFSEDYGKMKLVAKSVRKNTSKLAGQTKLFSLIDFSFVLGKSYNILTSTLEIENFTGIKSSLRKTESAVYIAKIIDKYTFFEKKDKELFNLLFKAFFYLSEKDLREGELDYFLSYFEYSFLAVLGYRPKEDSLKYFFDHKGTFSRKELSYIRLTLKRYFKNIFNEV